MVLVDLYFLDNFIDTAIGWINHNVNSKCLSFNKPGCKTDCIVCVSDRRMVSAHLPLAWTHSSPEEVRSFMTQLEILAQAAKQPRTDTQPSFDPTY